MLRGGAVQLRLLVYVEPIIIKSLNISTINPKVAKRHNYFLLIQVPSGHALGGWSTQEVFGSGIVIGKLSLNPWLSYMIYIWSIWRFTKISKMGLPLNHPFIDGFSIFHEINPHFRTPPYASIIMLVVKQLHQRSGFKADVQQECRDVLGPAGVDAVQVSPVTEHILGHQWWVRRGSDVGRACFSNVASWCW